MRHALLLSVIFALLLGAQGMPGATVSGPHAVRPPPLGDPGQTGPYDVGYTNDLVIDPSRDMSSGFSGRPLPVSIWYPAAPSGIGPATPEAVYPLDPLFSPGDPAFQSPSSDWEAVGFDRAYQEPPSSADGPFPLVIFSPGWGAAAFMHTFIGARLASHGFVTAVIYHCGDQFWPWEPPYDHVAVASFNRPRDVSFVLSDLLARNLDAADVLHGLIDSERIAAAGWSLGGYAAMTLAGGDDSVCDLFFGVFAEDPPAWTCAPSPVDTRIKAIVPLDGSSQALHFWELARVIVPAMGMGEEWSTLAANVAAGTAPPGWEAWQARHHAAFSGRPAYRVDVFNTIHQSFSDVLEGVQVLAARGLVPASVVDLWQARFADATPSADVHALMSRYMVAFLKTQLAGQAGYQHVLTPGWALTREPYSEFFVTEKRSPQSIDEDWPAFVYFPHQPGSEQFRAEKAAARAAVARAVPWN